MSDYLPKVKNTEKLQSIYKKLNNNNLDTNKEQFEHVIEMQKLYYNLIESFGKWQEDRNNKSFEQKIHANLIKYIDFFDYHYKNFEIAGSLYYKLKDFYKEIKAKFSYTDLTENCIFIFNYQNLKYESKNDFDLLMAKIRSKNKNVLFVAHETEEKIEVNQKTVIAYQDSADLSTGTAVVFQNESTNLTAENYIGISDGAYADAATATIQIAGAVDDAQTGLTAGQSYFVQTDGTLSETPDDPSVFAGTAISATKIVVQG
jgi:hypothetical protein